MVPAPCDELKSTNSATGGEAELLGVYEEHSAALSRYAFVLTKDPETARDAVQEVFLRYFIERRFGRVIRNPKGWLYQVLRNYLVDSHRRPGKREVLSENLDRIPSAQQNPEMALQIAETAQGLKSLLSDREMECVRFRAQGLDYREIGDAMAIETSTVGALLTRAVKKVRDATSGRVVPMATTRAVLSLLEEWEPVLE